MPEGKPNTYTLVIAGELTQVDCEYLVAKRIDASSKCHAVLARWSHGESLVLVHTLEDHSRYGRALAEWLGEPPFDPPYPTGALLWYR